MIKKLTLENKILMLIAVFIGLGVIFVIVNTERNRQNDIAIQQRINAYQPVIMTESVAEKESYKTDDVVQGYFTFERFTAAPSSLIRTMTCSISGVHQVDAEPIPLTGSPIGKRDRVLSPILSIGGSMKGNCTIRFSQTFVEQIEQIDVQKTVNFAIPDIMINL